MGKTFLPALKNRMITLEEARKEAVAVHETTCWIMREHSTQKFTPWKVGDKVWLEAMNLRLRYPSRKLSPKRQGPFKIAQVLSPLTYHLRLPSTWRIHNVFHATLLLLYKETVTHGPNFLSPPPVMIGSKEEYKVDRIVSHKGSPG